MSNSKLNKLKSATKNGTEVTLNLLSNLMLNSNFPHKLLLTDTQISKIRKAFANGPSAKINLSKTQLSRTVQLGGFLFVPPNIFALTIKEIISSSANSIISSFVKELKNMDPEEIDSNLSVDIGLNVIGKKIKK